MSAYVNISAVPKPGDTTAFKHRTGDICGWRIGPLTIQFRDVTEARKWLAECVNTLNATDAALADYDRYRDTLDVFDADAAPATFGEWWQRYADNYESER